MQAQVDVRSAPRRSADGRVRTRTHSRRALVLSLSIALLFSAAYSLFSTIFGRHTTGLYHPSNLEAPCEYLVDIIDPPRPICRDEFLLY